MTTHKNSLNVDCKERVAFDLMSLVADIAKGENGIKDRAYWFELYSQCHHIVVEGRDSKEIL
ncbi:MAG: hypothetical protein COB04_07585 [Gammaproteobacteria bacterium]|nr:MAG: hypothetical protein COB04_07585 [Gammaproteobacteria bacterium]